MRVHGRGPARVMRSCLLLLGIASLAISARAAADCSRMYQVAQQVLASSRMIVTPVPSGGNGCSVQLRDSGSSNSSVGTLTATAYGNAGPLLTDYRRATDRCETMDGLGQMAELCIFSEDYYHHRLSLVVYRNDRRVLDLNFVDWPSPRNPARAEARSLADGILGAFAPAPLKEPVLSKSGSPGDRAEQLKRELAPKAEAGNTEAQFALATLYQDGTRSADGKLSPDYAAAAYWYQQASGRGMVRAMRALARLYEDGRGVPKDESISIELLKKAATSGDVQSMAELGAAYLRPGTFVGRTLAKPWLQKAVDAGDAGAAVDLGVLYYGNAREGGIGMAGLQQRDYDSAMKSYRIAADAGNCVASMNIGGLYFNGDGVPQDKRQAESWFAKAEACARANRSAILDKASRFRQKASTGELPAVQAATSPASKMSPGEVVLWGLAIGVAAAVAMEIAHGPSTAAEMRKIREDREDNDRDARSRDERDREMEESRSLRAERERERERQSVEDDRKLHDRTFRCGFQPKVTCF